MLMLTVLACVTGCRGAAQPARSAVPPVAARAPAPKQDTAPARAPAAAPAREPVALAPVVFTGMCDASGAVPIGPGTFIVADDERNQLHVYEAGRAGSPVAVVDVSRGAGADDEIDLEAATRLGDHALWLGSHGRNKKGKLREDRLRLFVTTIGDSAEEIRVVGAPYLRLLDDLLMAPALAPFGLAEAAERPPKAPGGLAIEGMTARPEGGVFIGFRNPVPDGKALIVPIENPLALAEGERARIGAPRLLDLGGLGVRALSWWRGSYLILAGPIDTGPAPRLYRWDGTSEVATLVPLDLGELNAEGFFTPEASDQILLLSDDGTRPVDGKACKKLDEPARQSFRGLWVSLPAAAR